MVILRTRKFPVLCGNHPTKQIRIDVEFVDHYNVRLSAVKARPIRIFLLVEMPTSPANEMRASFSTILLSDHFGQSASHWKWPPQSSHRDTRFGHHTLIVPLTDMRIICKTAPTANEWCSAGPGSVRVGDGQPKRSMQTIAPPLQVGEVGFKSVHDLGPSNAGCKEKRPLGIQGDLHGMAW